MSPKVQGEARALLEHLAEVPAEALAPIAADLGLDPARLRPAGDAGAAQPSEEGGLLLALSASARPREELAGPLEQLVDAALGPRGWLVLFLAGPRKPAELAAWRDRLWPLCHVGAIYRVGRESRVERWTLAGRGMLELAEVRALALPEGTFLCAQRRLAALAPAVTVAKFDANSAGWNGAPGSPGYGHFRWMRRYVARFARVRPGARILDFGCGAGWVGIEAALYFGARSLRAFDPSPQMVRLATENARASALADFEATTGFGEDPPYPRAGEPPYDLVLSSGVISFAPRVEPWLEGLDRCVAPGGQLVIGDVSPSSFGMRRRRRTRPLLPARELGARTALEVRARLEALGYVLRAAAGYQLTTPVPELAARAGRALSRPLLLANRLAAGRLPGVCFDSWLMRFDKQAR